MPFWRPRKLRAQDPGRRNRHVRSRRRQRQARELPRVLKQQRIEIMPKLKTHSGAAKRFKKTASGRVKRGHAFSRHILTSKPTKRKRQLDTNTMVDKADQPKIKRMIPY